MRTLLYFAVLVFGLFLLGLLFYSFINQLRHAQIQDTGLVIFGPVQLVLGLAYIFVGKAGLQDKKWAKTPTLILTALPSVYFFLLGGFPFGLILLILPLAAFMTLQTTDIQRK